jgi:hypothetical protein
MIGKTYQQKSITVFGLLRHVVIKRFFGNYLCQCWFALCQNRQDLKVMTPLLAKHSTKKVFIAFGLRVGVIKHFWEMNYANNGMINANIGMRVKERCHNW